MDIRLQIAGLVAALISAGCVTRPAPTEIAPPQQSADSRASAARAAADARRRILIAEAHTRHDIARADCNTLSSNSTRYNCFAAADAKLEQELSRLP